VSARLLVGEFGPVVMSLPGPADLGTLPLAAGVFLSGTVLSAGGAPLAGVDVDVLFAGTQEEVPLVDDVTGSDGTYLTVVPTGTFDVTFTPATCSAFGAATVQDFAIAGDALLDATLSLPTSGGTPTPIALGNRFAGSFSACDDLDEISFEGVAGMLASIDARRSTGSARPGFVLIAPSSAVLDLAPFTSIGASGTKATSVPLPETGTYHVVVLSANGSPGPYSVRTKGKAAATLKKVLATGAVAASGATVDVAFAALAGGTLKGKVLSGGSGLDPSVELVGPGDTPISLDGWTVSKPGVSVSLLGVPLPATGAYTLRVGGANGTTGAFTAQLKVGFPKVPPTVVLEP
jgi:hypothetical protein